MNYSQTKNNGLEKKSFFKSLALLEVGFLEFIFVIVVLILFFGTLNYFNILPLSTVFPQYLSWLPRLNTPTKSVSIPTPSPSSIPGRGRIVQVKEPIVFSPSSSLKNPLAAKAKSLGYNIILIDPKDITGRTAFYEGKEIYNNEGWGVKTYTNTKDAKFINQIIGSFSKFQNINNSNDKYIQLTDPKTKQNFPLVRINMDIQKSLNLNEEIPTQLLIENLDINSSESPESAVQSLGSLGNFKAADLEKISKIGDAVAVGVLVENQKNPKDEFGNLKAISVFIRRFGGKDQITRELE